MSEIVLFEFEGCPFCRKVYAALQYKGVPFARRIVKTSSDYLELSKYNPTRQAPVLLYDEEVISDSTKIINFLEEKHAKPSLLPKTQEEKVFCHFLEDWADEALSWYGSTFRWVDPQNQHVAKKQLRLANAKGPFAWLFPTTGRLIGKVRVWAQGTGRRPIEQIETDLKLHLGRLSTLLETKSFLFGDELSLADLAIWSQLWAMRYCAQEDLIKNHQTFGPYLQRIDDLLQLDI